MRTERVRALAEGLAAGYLQATMRRRCRRSAGCAFGRGGAQQRQAACVIVERGAETRKAHIVTRISWRSRCFR